MKCRFCQDNAVVKVYLSKGCICYPDDHEQDLCIQHLKRATPLGTMELVEDYTTEKFFQKGGEI
jgi:hypothetical protein